MPAFMAGISSIGLVLLIAAPGFTQDYPSKPLRIVTIEAGGGLDLISRFLAQGLSGPLGQPVVVENRGGAGGSLAIELVAKAAPDGYTVLVIGSPLWLLPFMREKVGWDPMKDFAPVSWVGSAPNVVVVHPSLPVKSVQDMIALAKARPGELNYGSGGLGSTNYIVAESFKAAAQLNLVHVPYKGAAPAFVGLISGQVQVMFPSAGSAVPYLKSGKLKGLAVTSSKPSELVPGLPTVASAVPGFEATSNYGVFLPAKTSPAIVNRLSQEIVRLLSMPESKARFLSSGLEAMGSSPEQLAALLKSEMTKMGKVIKDAGIVAN